MEKVTLKIEGMTCEHCVAHVTEALQGLPGVEETNVSLDKGEASVVFDPTQTSTVQMADAVEDAGYDVVGQ
jgi:copper chaperone